MGYQLLHFFKEFVNKNLNFAVNVMFMYFFGDTSNSIIVKNCHLRSKTIVFNDNLTILFNCFSSKIHLYESI